MVCAECGVFLGDPTCGACRAVSRIGGLLRSGQLRESQQRRVTEILRGAAGELSDLVESNQGAGEPERSLPEKEGTAGLTSGPKPAPAEEAAAEKADTEYSYETEEEEEPEQANVESAGKGDRKPEGDLDKEEVSDSPPLSPGTREKKLAERRSNFDPQFLTKRLCLTPAPKPHSGKKARSEGSADPGKEPATGSRREEHPGEERSPEAEGASAAADRHDEDSEGRTPLPRRPQQPPKKAKSSRGAKKRERTKQFREKKIEERRARKAKRDRECPQRQKRKGWGGRDQWRS